MKNISTKYICALETKHQIDDSPHREELIKLALEKELEEVKLEVLKSQVNPHFLFNTLNMISGMAKMEHAVMTDHMIVRLGNIFRYHLRTNTQEVYLEDEIDALDDYMYIQQMRFGERLEYCKRLHVEEQKVKIPSFTLQPLVENCIVHGLADLQDGGRIILKAFERGGRLIVTIADNGKGMSGEEKAALEERMKSCDVREQGIGLGNICRRISMLYEDGSLCIFSKKGKGTVIRLEIPQEDKKDGGIHVQDIDSRR